MATITFTKDTSKLTYSDYQGAKAALRLAELTTTIPTQQIVRRHDTPTVQALLLQPAWYAGRIAAYAAVSGATFAESQTIVSDDYLSGNLSTMIDLARGHAQVPSELRRVVEAGLTNNAFKTWVILDSAKTNTDADPGRPLTDYLKQYGGNVLAYLVHPALYSALAAAPQAIGYAGTGNGKASLRMKPGTSVAENITVTCTAAVVNGGTFSVVGSSSGAYAAATVGTQLETSHFYLTVSDGTVDFLVGDVFTIPVVAASF